MSTIDYSSFATPTGNWAGSSEFPPEHLGLYSSIKSSVTDLDKNNPIINFTFNLNGDDGDYLILDASGKLKVVPMGSLNLPFDRAYLDISSYDDYLLLKNNSGIWADENPQEDFWVAYTSGGFWAMGPKTYSSPGIIFVADSGPNENIINLNWTPVYRRNISVGQYDENGFIDINSFDYFEANITGGITGLKGFKLDKNSYPWQRKRININALGDITGFVVSGLDSNSVPKILTLTGLSDLTSVEFYWSGNNLYKENSPNPTGFLAPSPFSGSIFTNSTNAGDYGMATIYADEPMIQYTKINDHTIRIDTTAAEVAALIPPLRKLYVKFSGIN